MVRENVVVETCDNPKCDYSEVIGDDGEGATGYHFGFSNFTTDLQDDAVAGYWVLGGGGPIPAFYAHAKKCILPAFEAVMERDRR